MDPAASLAEVTDFETVGEHWTMVASLAEVNDFETATGHWKLNAERRR